MTEEDFHSIDVKVLTDIFQGVAVVLQVTMGCQVQAPQAFQQKFLVSHHLKTQASGLLQYQQV